MKFFTSDLHLFHTRILEFCPQSRPFQTVEEMHKTMVAAWNAKVAEGDEVYILGDISWGKESETAYVLRSLNGHKHLIYGNHDKLIRRSKYLQDIFESVQEYKELRIDGTKVVMSHYPFEVWNESHHGSLHLFGHLHGNTSPKGHTLQNIPNRMDVGIDTRTDLSPWSWGEICGKLGA